MSHIDEGLLHAHLDGAVDSGDLDWQTALVHLEDCPDCTRRLEEARRLRDGAIALLAEADAPVAARPSFAELEARAAIGDGEAGTAPGPARSRSTGRGSSGWFTAGRLAWAASLVMAAGAGWIGRELAIQEGVFSEPVLSQVESEVSPLPADAAREARDSRDAGQEADLSRAESDAEPEQLQRSVRASAGAAAPEESERLANEEPAGERGLAVDEARKAEEAPRGGEAQGRVVEGEDRAALADADNLAAFRQRADSGEISPRCYVGKDASRLTALDLGPGRVARAQVDGRSYVGYWTGPARGDGQISVRLSDGIVELALEAQRTGEALSARIRGDGADGTGTGEMILAEGTCGATGS